MTAIKICGLRTLADARHAAQCGADLLGFILVPASRRYLPPAELAPLAAQLRDEGCPARLAGVVAGLPLPELLATAAACRLDVVQLHGDEPPEYVTALRAIGVEAIVARRVREAVPWAELAAYDPWATLLDGYDAGQLGGTGRPWRWELLAGAPAGMGRLILAGGLTPANVARAIRAARPWGVDVASGVEREPGRKDPALVERFIQAVRAEEQR